MIRRAFAGCGTRTRPSRGWLGRTGSDAAPEPWEDDDEWWEPDATPAPASSPGTDPAGGATVDPHSEPGPAAPSEATAPPSTPALPATHPSTDASSGARLPPDADAILETWLRRESSDALAAVAGLGLAGGIAELGRLAQLSLEEPRVAEGARPSVLWLELARLLAFVDAAVAKRLVDAAWAHAAPDERAELDLHDVDLCAAAAPQVAAWPIEARTVLVRVAAGAHVPPPPRPGDWEKVLALLRRSPPRSPLVRWLAVEARDLLEASGARIIGTSAHWQEPLLAKLRRLPLWPALAIVVTAAFWPLWRFQSLSPPVDRGLDLPFASRALARAETLQGGSGAALERQALTDLDALFPPPGPDEVQARSTLTALAREDWFRRAWQSSARVREKVRALRTLYLPADEALVDDPALGVPDAVPR